MKKKIHIIAILFLFVNVMFAQSYKQVDVILQFGQSNIIAQGGTDLSLIPIDENGVKLWNVNNQTNAGNWAENVNMQFRINTPGGVYSSADITSAYWAQSTHREVYVFKHVRGGSSLESTVNNPDWNIATNDELYDRFLEEWDLFVSDLKEKNRIPRVIAAFWVQGENEVFGPASNRNNYFFWWKQLRKAVDEKVGYSLRWIVWTLNPDQYDYDPTVKGVNVQTLRSIQLNDIGSEPNVTVKDTSPYTLQGDRIHYDNATIISASYDDFIILRSLQINPSYEIIP